MEPARGWDGGLLFTLKHYIPLKQNSSRISKACFELNGCEGNSCNCGVYINASLHENMGVRR